MIAYPKKQEEIISPPPSEPSLRSPLARALAYVIADRRRIPVELITREYLRTEIEGARAKYYERAARDGKRVVPLEELCAAGGIRQVTAPLSKA